MEKNDSTKPETQKEESKEEFFNADDAEEQVFIILENDDEDPANQETQKTNFQADLEKKNPSTENQEANFQIELEEENTAPENQQADFQIELEEESTTPEKPELNAKPAPAQEITYEKLQTEIKQVSQETPKASKKFESETKPQIQEQKNVMKKFESELEKHLPEEQKDPREIVAKYAGLKRKTGKVFSGSPAEGILQRNDEIRIVDNCNVENATSKDVQDLVRASGNQLNFIVVRNSNKPRNYDGENDDRISVQNSRSKFANNESRSPFGQFGTEFHKKSNTLPTSLTIETNNDYSYKDDIVHKNYEMDEDDVVDYNFMTLPVSERKKLFATPNENMGFKTMPRQRFNSYRPTYKTQTLPKPQTTIYDKKPQDFGWQPSPQSLERARKAALNQSTVPARYQNTLSESPRITRTTVNKVSNAASPRYHTTTRIEESNRRFSSSTTMPRQMGKNLTSSMLNFNDGYLTQPRQERVQSKTQYIYHCGPSREVEPVQPSIMVIPSNSQPHNLYVNTYGATNPASPSAHSPRYFRPAYPAYSTDHNQDNMSIISVRSEPYAKKLDRSLGYERTGTYRILRDSTSAQRETSSIQNENPFDRNRLQIGEPRTRIVANPASPSYHLNWSFWGEQSKPEQMYNKPTQTFHVQPQPKIVNSRSFKLKPTVPKSQSTLVMNKSSTINDNLHSEPSWLSKHRDSSAGISDF